MSQLLLDRSHTGSMPARPFDIPDMFARIREALKPYAAAAMFILADEGYTSPFEQLLACMISIRTRDEVTLPAARSLFAVARTPAELRKLTVVQIDQLIRTCTFHDQKARQMHTIAERLITEHHGELPCEEEVLLALPGVGPKCANLVLGIACSQAKISVDVHVWRVVNRWGYVSASTPEKTMVELERVLPQEYWIDTNRLLMPFGKHICTGIKPKCTGCPVLAYCRQVGVTEHR